MKKNVFLSVFIPFLVLLTILFAFFVFVQQDYSLSLTQKTLRNTFAVFKGDAEFTVAHYEDYEKRINKRVSEYRFADIFYAWLLKSDGTELSVSAYKKNIDPEALRENTELFLPYIKANQPSSFVIKHSKKNLKMMEYTVIPGTPLILAVIADIPNSDLPAHKYFPFFAILFSLLLLAGMFWINGVSSRILSSLSSLISYGAKLFHGDRPNRPEFDDKNLDSVAFFMEGLAKKGVIYVEEDRNSVTGVKGTSFLEKRLFEEIDLKKPFAVCEVLIRYFQPYLSRYGKIKSENFMRYAAMVVMNSTHEFGTESDIVVQVDKDRFVIVTVPLKAEDICESIIRNFESGISSFYDESDIEKGFILSKDKNGDIGSYPVAQTVIGVATNNHIPLIHPLQIAHITYEIITYLSLKAKSAYLIDRRTTDRTPYVPQKSDESGNEGLQTPHSEGEIVAEEIAPSSKTSFSIADDPEFLKQVKIVETRTQKALNVKKKKYSDVIKKTSKKVKENGSE